MAQLLDPDFTDDAEDRKDLEFARQVSQRIAEGRERLVSLDELARELGLSDRPARG
jgi:predicted DNA-binding protein